MSLYYDAASILSLAEGEGSLKSRIYGATANLKSKPAHVYALISETAKCDSFLKEVIENTGILGLESKLTPLLSLLLVHDHLFSKSGIAAPVKHPLRQAVERHKARLQAEFTKSRLRRRCATVEELKATLQVEKQAGIISLQPRWVRVNVIKTSLAKQLETTFAEYHSALRLEEVTTGPNNARVLHIDNNVPCLLALPRSQNLTKTEAYNRGEIILQDKASCFPAYLLLGSEEQETHDIGDVMDACAAPGNKTTHLASILSSRSGHKGNIFACERDTSRARTLQKMVDLAGANKLVTVLPGQDFLALDPDDARFKRVTHLLLDPSCSGSGIVGREDVPVLALPNPLSASTELSKKRKRTGLDDGMSRPDPLTLKNELQKEGETRDSADSERLEKLSNIQTRIIQHAFTFPGARRISYSTCSVHITENEGVVARALNSETAKRYGWRILSRKEQALGMKKWQRRGISAASETFSPWKGSVECDSERPQLDDDEKEACIRCCAGDEAGTMGFFVCGFERSQSHSDRSGQKTSEVVESSHWEGFAD